MYWQEQKHASIATTTMKNQIFKVFLKKTVKDHLKEVEELRKEMLDAL